MIKSHRPFHCGSRSEKRQRWHRAVHGLCLVGPGLFFLVMASGCADPLMRKSQLPETIDYSGGDLHQAPALPPVPATAPTAEVLKPATIPAALATTEPAAVTTRPSDGDVLQPLKVPATQPASIEPSSLPATLPAGLPDTRPGL